MTRVKAHFRHLPNGTLVRIDEYTDKRQKAQQQPAAHRGKLVHADATSTSVVDHKGATKTYAHDAEMSQQQLHAHLNKPLPVNADLAHQVVKHKLGIDDHNQFIADAVEEEGYKSKPRFTDAKGAADWFHQTHVAPKLKELRDAHGKTTSRAKAALAKHKDLRDMWAAHAEGEGGASAHQQAEGQMVGEHAEDAHAAAETAMDQGAAAQGKGPKDAPQVPAIGKDIKFFGHQAQALAQLNVLEAGITDVDMGGGKGLILPADALALMGQGKVKRPLIVVPAATLDQNADLLTGKYTNGKVNVFKISTDSIAKHHGGDIESVVAAIKAAPPNTVFMASYDAISHQDREGAPERFPHAAALGAAGFDYVAADECHNIRNEDSARFQAFSHLAGAKYKRMASGTFLANDPRDVVGPLKLLFPSMDIDQKKLEKFYGRKETNGEATWSPHGLKRLRQQLLDVGMVSLRRSAWLDKLPKRQDKLSVVQMLPQQQRVHDAVLNDAINQLETDAKTDPLLAKALADDSLDNAWEAPPALMRKLEIMQGVTDYPDELARIVKGRTELVAGATGKGRSDYQPEEEEAAHELEKLSPAARNAILSLEGMVSPKALDVYAKAKKHLADKKNGKFMVFVQRKAAAQHLMRNLPPELAPHAMYFDASKLDELHKFTGSDSEGPRLLIAVDASIKEGVNMQAANGLYRYDHHLTPGNQEQSYARIWRFGQTRPTDIHLGIMDGGMDVAKYARLCSKNWVNQQVVSDFESDKTTPIYKLSVKNLREKRDANILNDYHDLNDDILKWQQGENKKYKAKFGEQPYDLATGDDIKGGKPAAGGAYHAAKKPLAKGYADWSGTIDIEGQAFDPSDPSSWAAVDKAIKSNWRYKQPAHVGSDYGAIGSKITNLPPAKLPRFVEIVQDAIKRKDSEDRLARRLRAAANAGGGGDDRDWHRVARTEVANARAAGALAHIIDEYGPDTLVFRNTNGCCPSCCHAFGRWVRRKWRAGTIPAKFVGVVHPNCKCGPWQLVGPMKRRAVRKSLAVALARTRQIPMGIVRRMDIHRGAPVYHISTGYGTWAVLDSITARCILRAVLARSPLVAVDGEDGIAWCRVGHGRPKKAVVSLLEPLTVAGARYYAQRPEDAREAGLNVKTRDDWIEVMLQILPVVVTMPEPWMRLGPSASPARYLPAAEFLGQNGLTDWWVGVPTAELTGDSLVAAEPAGAGSVRALVRVWAKRMLAGDSFEKGAS